MNADAGPGPTGASFRRERTIRFSDCDPAGIVFYPQYFVMFNDLVEQWFDDELALGYRRVVAERRIGLPTVHLDADFKAVSRFGDRVVLSLRIERVGGKSIGLHLRCDGDDNGSGVLRMTMRQTLVATSLDTHRAIDLPADLRQAITRFAGPDSASSTAQAHGHAGA